MRLFCFVTPPPATGAGYNLALGIVPSNLPAFLRCVGTPPSTSRTRPRRGWSSNFLPQQHNSKAAGLRCCESITSCRSLHQQQLYRPDHAHPPSSSASPGLLRLINWQEQSDREISLSHRNCPLPLPTTTLPLGVCTSATLHRFCFYHLLFFSFSPLSLSLSLSVLFITEVFTDKKNTFQNNKRTKNYVEMMLFETRYISLCVVTFFSHPLVSRYWGWGGVNGSAPSLVSSTKHWRAQNYY